MFQKISYSLVLDTSRRNFKRESEIMVHCAQGRKSVDIPTSIYCLKDQFSDGKINDKNPMSEGLNAMLIQILTDVEQTEIEAFRKDIHCSVQTIYSIYVDNLNTTLPLTTFCEAVMRYSPQRKQITKDKYTTSIKMIDAFSPGITLEDIDLNFLKRFETYCADKGNADSTVWSHMKCLRSLYNEAIKRDLLKPWQTPFKLYEIPEHRSRTDVIRWREIEYLMDYEFTGNDKKFSRIRDIVCFACFTGLRVADILRLKDENIEKVGGVTWLRIHTQKTGAFVQIPLSIIFYGLAMDVLRKYGSIEEMVLYKDRTGLNRAVSKMVKIVGIAGNMRVTMHTCRRSFITSLADFGTNVYIIQRLAGHSRITTTEKYMQLSTQSIENELTNIFKKDTMRKQHEVVYVRRNGEKLYADSEYLRCSNCKFFLGGKKGTQYRCSKRKCKVKVYDWCTDFKEKRNFAN